MLILSKLWDPAWSLCPCRAVRDKTLIIKDIPLEKAYKVCTERGEDVSLEHLKRLYATFTGEYPQKDEG